MKLFKNKLAVLSMLLALCISFATSCTKKSHSGELIVGTNAGYPPYESVNHEGKIEGFDIDVAHAIAAKLNKKLVVKDLSFDSLILGLNQDKFDFIISGMSITSAREKEIAMVPYQGELMKSYVLAFFGNIPESIKSIHDVKNYGNKTIAVQTGTIMEEYLRRFPDVISKPLESTSELVMDVKYQKSVAALLEPRIAKEVAAKHSEVKQLEIPLPIEDWVKGNGIGIKKQNTRLLQQIQKAVDDLKKEGVIKTLEQK